MFYIICDGTVCESLNKCPTDDDLQQWANDLDAEAYVIRGEHYGMTAYPQSDDDEEDEEDEEQL